VAHQFLRVRQGERCAKIRQAPLQDPVLAQPRPKTCLGSGGRGAASGTVATRAAGNSLGSCGGVDGSVIGCCPDPGASIPTGSSPRPDA
jgi:hypothetical protein